MAKSKESFDRRQRARAKKAKADAKRERRLSGEEEPADEAEEERAPTADQDVILAALAALHAEYDDERITFDDFEERRAALLAQLQVD